MKRKKGFYWVKMQANIFLLNDLEWMVAYWDGYHWYLPGLSHMFNDADWEQIKGPTIIEKIF